jgi:hypothetical protein
MASIQFWGSPYDGTADGEYGVFTSSCGRVFVFEGSHANGCARVGVHTTTNGTTYFAECDADGQEDGRYLYCFVNGETQYILREHGNIKEHALLEADGTCWYDGKACSADYAPFVQLQAKVEPIKARPQ